MGFGGEPAVDILVEGKTFTVPREFLNTHSEYFRALLDGK